MSRLAYPDISLVRPLNAVFFLSQLLAVQLYMSPFCEFKQLRP